MEFTNILKEYLSPIYTETTKDIIEGITFKNFMNILNLYTGQYIEEYKNYIILTVWKDKK